MAQKQAAPAFVLVALLVFAAATPTAYGQGGLLGLGDLVGQLTNGINVNGQVFCSSNGNSNGTAAGISGVVVKVNCTTGLLGTSITVGQGVTGVNGTFSISIRSILNLLGITVTSILNGGLPCTAIVNLPINQTVCPILNTATGILAGVPVLANSVITPIVGSLANLTVPLFFNVKIG